MNISGMSSYKGVTLSALRSRPSGASAPMDAASARKDFLDHAELSGSGKMDPAAARNAPDIQRTDTTNYAAMNLMAWGMMATSRMQVEAGLNLHH